MSKPYPKFKAVLFDLDNTLYDRYAVFERFVTAYIVNVLKFRHPQSVLDIRDRLIHLDGNGYGNKCEVETEIRRMCAVRRLPHEAAEVLAARFYKDFFETIQLDHSAKELLWALAEQSLPWGIVTNGRTRQWRKIEKLGLDKLSASIFVSETFGTAKPDRNIFLAAAKSLGVAPRNILFIGDDPINDIGGACSAGMFTAWVSYGEEWPTKYGDILPDMILNSVGDLLPLVRTRKSAPLSRQKSETKTMTA